MDLNEIKKSLRNFGFKITSPRLKVLEAFSSERGITLNELQELTDKTVDRVTLYRTLKSFEETGFIHRIIGLDNIPAYILSKIAAKEDNNHFQQHIHFSCVKCRNVYCLNDLAIPSVILPERYRVQSMNLTVVGVCKLCNLFPID